MLDFPIRIPVLILIPDFSEFNLSQSQWQNFEFSILIDPNPNSWILKKMVDRFLYKSRIFGKDF